eukprot:COSAG02_NODE_262_length_26647_cov_21.607240_12_plen_126_part_00
MIDSRNCGVRANGTVSEAGLLGLFHSQQAGFDPKNKNILRIQKQQDDPVTGTTRVGLVISTTRLFAFLACVSQLILRILSCAGDFGDRSSSPRNRVRLSSSKGTALLPRSLSRSLSSGGALEKEL